MNKINDNTDNAVLDLEAGNAASQTRAIAFFSRSFSDYDLAASLGLAVPMMAGRALGNTGGTLDKLESIPGLTTNLSETAFRSNIIQNGYAICGQSEDCAPADRVLYALRDVTATVESVPLITASILSKKAAEGAQALVMDVKCGSGAFMHDRKDAEALAHSLKDTGGELGLKVSALVTAMNQPLGRAVGNWLEVEETLDLLEDYDRARETAPDVVEITLALTAQMAVLGKIAPNSADAEELCVKNWKNGSGLRLFRAGVEAQGGDLKAMDAMRGTFRTAFHAELTAPAAGFVENIDAGRVGQAATLLGVGRNRKEDPVCPGASILFAKKAGESVAQGAKIADIWAKDAASLPEALPLLRQSLTISPEKPPATPLVLETI
jgi:pyrimidine-nucleoside phosphorylase